MPEGSRHRNLPLLSYLAVFAIAALAYAASLRNGPVWDDLPLVIDNPHLRSVRGLSRLFTGDLWSASAQGEPSSFYRPLTMVSFWLNAHIGGYSAASFRLGNILLHAGNALLLVAVLRQRGLVSPPVAAVVALIWAVAPVSSEPVLWISGRFDLLVVFFALGALLAAGVAREPREAPTRRWWAVVAMLGAVAAGILAKESFIGWLPVLVIDDSLFSASTPSGRFDASVLPRRPLIAKYAGVLACMALYFSMRQRLELPSAAIALHMGPRVFLESFFFLVATFWRVLFLPTALDPFRPYAPLPGLPFALTLALFVAVSWLLLGWFRRTRSSPASFALLGWVWFILATIPSALVGPNLDMIGDRYAYLPVVGLFFILGAWLSSVMPKLRAATRAERRRAWLAAAGLLGAEIGLNVRHFDDWRDDTSLARSSLASSPGNPYALYSLGSMAARKGDLATADALLRESIQRDDRSWRTWNAICFLRMHQNRLDEAEIACRAGLERHPSNPRGWVNLASIGIRRRDWAAAAAAANRAVALKPGYAEACYLAAVSAANLGKIDEARRHLTRGLESDPNHPRLRDFERQLQARGLAP